MKKMYSLILWVLINSPTNLQVQNYEPGTFWWNKKSFGFDIKACVLKFSTPYKLLYSSDLSISSKNQDDNSVNGNGIIWWLAE